MPLTLRKSTFAVLRRASKTTEPQKSTSISSSSAATFADAGSVGVNYGRIADNLPSAYKVAALIKSQGLERVKVFNSDPVVLPALSGSGIKVTVDLPNELLSSTAKTQMFATNWVQRNVVAYHPNTQIEVIFVGNGVFVDTHNTTKYLIAAMKNIRTALVKFNLADVIKVSSPIALSALQNSYPSSVGSFSSSPSSGP